MGHVPHEQGNDRPIVRFLPPFIAVLIRNSAARQSGSADRRFALISSVTESHTSPIDIPSTTCAQAP